MAEKHKEETLGEPCRYFGGELLQMGFLVGMDSFVKCRLEHFLLGRKDLRTKVLFLVETGSNVAPAALMDSL